MISSMWLVAIDCMSYEVTSVSKASAALDHLSLETLSRTEGEKAEAGTEGNHFVNTLI